MSKDFSEKTQMMGDTSDLPNYNAAETSLSQQQNDAEFQQIHQQQEYPPEPFVAQQQPYPPQQQQYAPQQQSMGGQPPVNLTRMQQQRLNQIQQLEKQQPQEVVQWMPMPQGIPGCPQGLEYLTQIDQLLVHQQVELLEVVANIEMANRYQIKNTLGQQCYFAEEESDFYMRNSCGAQRAFQMHLTDNTGREVIRVNREFKCCTGCCWCATGGHCSHIVEVESPPGTVVGKVVQSQTSWAPYFSIFDGDDKEVFKMRGPCCVCSGPCCADDVPFEIFAGSGDDTESPIGRISKQYSGVIKESLTDATNFSVTFPIDLDVRMKAVLLGATFLIDFMFFEQAPNNNNRD